MKLEEFRNEKRLTFAQLAALIDARSAKQAERYCKGVMPRDPKIVQKIFSVTDGRVTPNDWHLLPVHPQEIAAPAPPGAPQSTAGSA